MFERFCERPLRVLVLEDHAFQRSVAVNMLRALGCGTYQGYLFSRPVDAMAFARLPCFGRTDGAA